MKRLALVAIAVLSLAVFAVADQINFNFTIGPPSSVTATSAGGMTSGPSMLISISDTTTGVNIPQIPNGTYVNGNTGPATSFVPIGSPPTLLLATFSGLGGNSVLVEDSMGNVLVSGSMQDNATLLSTFPIGTGSFLGTFDVSFVSPAALALFGLGPSFQPVGSVAFTFAGATFDGTTLTGLIGGGSVTIQTPTATPEPAGLGIVGMGLVLIAEFSRRKLGGRF
jgi:hypothetical protein